MTGDDDWIYVLAYVRCAGKGLRTMLNVKLPDRKLSRPDVSVFEMESTRECKSESAQAGQSGTIYIPSSIQIAEKRCCNHWDVLVKII